MVEIVWTEPAPGDLDAIADYIAVENLDAARALVQRVFAHVGQLRRFPASGSRPPELSGRRYRQIIEPRCRIFYRELAMVTKFESSAQAALARRPVQWGWASGGTRLTTKS